MKDLDRIMKLIVNLILLFIALIIRLLPHKVLILLAHVLAFLLRQTKLRKKIVEKNFMIVFGERKSEYEKKKIFKEAYLHTVLVLLESLKSIFMTKNQIKKIVSFDEESKKALANYKQGIIFSVHMGNWEYGALAFLIYDIETGVIFKKIKRIFDNYFLLKYLRRRTKENAFLKDEKNLSWKLVKFIRQKLLIIAVDQKATSKEAVTTKIFNREVDVYKWPYILARRTEAPTFFVYTYREKNLKTHKVRFLPIKLDCSKENFLNSIDKIYNKFEQALEEHPAQWIWMHDFWKKKF